MTHVRARDWVDARAAAAKDANKINGTDYAHSEFKVCAMIPGKVKDVYPHNSGVDPAEG